MFPLCCRVTQSNEINRKSERLSSPKTMRIVMKDNFLCSTLSAQDRIDFLCTERENHTDMRRWESENHFKYIIFMSHLWIFPLFLLFIHFYSCCSLDCVAFLALGSSSPQFLLLICGTLANKNMKLMGWRECWAEDNETFFFFFFFFFPQFCHVLYDSWSLLGPLTLYHVLLGYFLSSTYGGLLK